MNSDWPQGQDSEGNRRRAVDSPAREPRQPSGTLRWIVFVIIFVILVLLVARLLHCGPWGTAEANLDEDVVVWVLGGSESFGLAMASSLTYTSLLYFPFECESPGYKLKVINGSVPAFNTTETLWGIDRYLWRLNPVRTGECADVGLSPPNCGSGFECEKADPDSPECKQVEKCDSLSAGLDCEALEAVRPNYAVILQGLNNRWNLRAGNYAKWADAQPSSGFKTALRKMDAGNAEELSKKNRQDFFEAFEEEGWSVFFDSFNDSLLKRWLEEDLTEMIRRIRGAGIEPVLMTYYMGPYPQDLSDLDCNCWNQLPETVKHSIEKSPFKDPIYLELNQQIRVIARENSVKLIDLEIPLNEYCENCWIYIHDDEPVLNEDGFTHVAKRIAEAIAVWNSEERTKE
jgi:hypothetical protein